MQEYINKTRSLIIAHATTSTNTKVLIPEGSVDMKEFEEKWAQPGVAIPFDPSDGQPVLVPPAQLSNELYQNVNKGSNNEEAKKKIEEAHVYAAKAGNEGQLFFKSMTAIFSSGSFEDAAAATEVASRTKGNLSYFYKALKEIREAKNVNLTPETKEEFGAAEDSIDI